MRYISRWHKKTVSYNSLLWLESELFPGVEFSVRKMSLSQRIDLSSRARALTLQNDFLQSGDVKDQLSATMADLLVQKLYIEWAAVELRGLSIDGEPASISLLVERGPEALVGEIVDAIRTHLELSEDERKNF